MYCAHRPLFRPRYPRLVAGVCAAFALEYGWDLVLVRILYVAGTVLTGIWIGFIAYIAAWIIIPEAPYLLPESVPQQPGSGVSA
jgi:phage shock protein C